MTLFKLEGAKKWQQTQDRFTPGRHDKRKFFTETGFPVKLDEAVPCAVPQSLKYVLPNTFCTDCAATDIIPDGRQGQNIHVVKEPLPAFDLKPGNAILCYICGPCVERDLFGPKVLQLPSRFRKANTQHHRETTIYDYLRALPPEARDSINVRPHGGVR